MSGIVRNFGVIGVLAVMALVYMSVFIIDEREQGLIIRFGEIQKSVSEPGLYFKLPIVDELVRVEDRIWMIASNDKEVQVSDGRRYRVDALTMLRVDNPRRFRETVGASEELARTRIETRIDSSLRQVYGRRSFDAALSKDRAAMMREIRDQVRSEAASLGIEVVDVRIRRTDLMPDVLNDTFERMNSERFAEAAELRAVGQAQATRIRAEADRAAVELVSKAKRESEIIRGEGDAKRNKVFAEAFKKDPDFFAFYRSMQAYAKSLSNSDTTLVLQPDSEFFRYFGNSGQNRPAP